MDNKTVYLWGLDGARAGSISFHLMGSPEHTVIEANISVAGLQNFDLWLDKVRKQVHEILLKQEEAEKLGEQPYTSEQKDE